MAAPRFRLGINTCFAVKRWPRPGDWAGIVRDRLGLRLVQHSFDLVDLARPANDLEDAAAETRGAVAEHGLELHSTFTGLAAYSSNLLLAPDASARDAALGWYERAIHHTALLGGRATGGHVGAFSVADWADRTRRKDLWSALIGSLGALATEARAAGLEYLVVENLAAEREPSTMAMIDDLLSAGDAARVPIRLCLDVGHMCAPGTRGRDRDPYAWLRAFGPGAPIVQLQQSDAEGDHHWPFTARRNALGRLSADRVIDALGESGATECAFVLEVIPPFEQPDAGVVDDLVESVAYWREALERRGVAAEV